MSETPDTAPRTVASSDADVAIGVAGPTLLRSEADRLERNGTVRKWGLLDEQGELVDKDGTFVELTPLQLRFAAIVLELAAAGERVGPGSAAAAPLPDLVCPKCGSRDTKMLHCAGERRWSSNEGRDDPCKSPMDEHDHFHHTCQRCRYQWRTDAVYSPPRGPAPVDEPADAQTRSIQPD